MDAEYHDQWAMRIAEGEWMGKEVFFRAPLYPYFLGAIYTALGHDYYLARLIQLILGSISCVLVYLVGREIFNWRVGLVASLIASFYGVFIYFDGELVYASRTTSHRAKHIWMGHPSDLGSPCPWSTLEVDYVKVERLP